MNSLPTVIANSFPKSGTHLLVQILHLLEYDMADLHLSRSLLNYGPKNLIRNAKVFQRIARHNDQGLSIDIETQSRKANKKWLSSHMKKGIIPGQFCQAHLPYSEELELFLLSENYKVLYIHRHPLDTLVSLKNYILKKKNYPIHKQLSQCSTDTERYHLLINGHRSNDNWENAAPFFQKYANSLIWSSSPSVCSVTFEELIGEKGGGTLSAQIGAINSILNHLGMPIEKAQSIAPNVYNPKSETFHKGKMGTWKEQLPEEIIEMCMNQLTVLNLDLDGYQL